MRSLASGGAAIFSFLSILIVTPVVAFYMLVDWEKMLATIDGWTPLDHRDAIRRIAREINHALAGFLRGQALVCLVLGLWYGIGLSADRAGFRIPDRGGRRLAEFHPLSRRHRRAGGGARRRRSSRAGRAGACFFSPCWWSASGQFLEGNVLAPRLVGKSIGLHPVWLMFALVAFGDLFGFTGLLIAVPMAAAIGVLARHLLAVYLVSPVYRGRRGAEARLETGGKP